MQAAQNTVRADELFRSAAPYLKELLQSAPMFGSAGITLVFYAGEITRVDVAASVQRKPKSGGQV